MQTSGAKWLWFSRLIGWERDPLLAVWFVLFTTRFDPTTNGNYSLARKSPQTTGTSSIATRRWNLSSIGKGSEGCTCLRA
jgi:hypothetical protein